MKEFTAALPDDDAAGRVHDEGVGVELLHCRSILGRRFTARNSHGWESVT